MSFLAVVDKYGVSTNFISVLDGSPSEVYLDLPADTGIRHVSLACADPQWLSNNSLAYNVYVVPRPALGPAVAEARAAAAAATSSADPSARGALRVLERGNNAIYCGYLAGFSPSMTFRPPTKLSLSGSLVSTWGTSPGQAGGPNAGPGATPPPGGEDGYSVLLSALPAEEVSSVLPHFPTEAEDEVLGLVMNRAVGKFFTALRRGLISDGQANYVRLSEIQRIKESLAREVKYGYFWN